MTCRHCQQPIRQVAGGVWVHVRIGADLSQPASSAMCKPTYASPHGGTK